MEWYQCFSDVNIVGFINTVKSEYFIVGTAVLAVASVIVVKTKTKLDDKALAWLKGKMKR